MAKRTATQRLEKRQQKLTKLKAKKDKLRSKRINLLEKLRAKNRSKFEWIVKDKEGKLRYKEKGQVIQTNLRQLNLDAEEWDKYKKIGEQENKTQENIWETEKRVRWDQKAVIKEKQKDEKEWESKYIEKVFGYVKKNGVDRHLIRRSVNTYLRTMGDRMNARNERQGQLKGFRGSWLKYNRGQVK